MLEGRRLPKLEDLKPLLRTRPLQLDPVERRLSRALTVEDLRTLEQIGASSTTSWVAWAVSWALPNLALLDVKAEVVHGIPIGVGQAAGAAAYGMAYSAAMLLLAVVIFQRRDFL